MTGFRQQSLSEGILNGSRVSSELVAIQVIRVGGSITREVTEDQSSPIKTLKLQVDLDYFSRFNRPKRC